MSNKLKLLAVAGSQIVVTYSSTAGVGFLEDEKIFLSCFKIQSLQQDYMYPVFAKLVHIFVRISNTSRSFVPIAGGLRSLAL